MRRISDIISDVTQVSAELSEVPQKKEQFDMSVSASGSDVKGESKVDRSADNAPPNRAEIMEEYEKAYKDPVVQSSINLKTNLILYADYHLEGDDKSVKFFTEFLGKIGHNGGTTTWPQLLRRIFVDKSVYGTFWTELLVSDEKIVDIDFIDAKTIDYARDNNGHMLLDENNKIKGFVHTIPYKYLEGKLGDPRPANIALPQTEGTAIFLLPKRVAPLKRNPIGSAYYGIGEVEVAYPHILFKWNLERQLIEMAQKWGTGILAAKVGDLQHQPSPTTINTFLDKIKKLKWSEGIAFPYHNELMFVEPKYAEKFLNYLKYYIDQIVTSGQVPAALATGSGEATNRSTLTSQEYMLKICLYQFIYETTEQIENYIFRPIAEQNGVTVPKIVWGELALEELDAKAKRLAQLASSGLLTPSIDLEKYILKSEEIDVKVDEKAWKDRNERRKEANTSGGKQQLEVSDSKQRGSKSTA